MGDNGTDEFDEEELQRRENQMAEEQAIEDFAGGTGSNDGESEEDNPYDLSRQFTGGDEFTGADEFARIGNSGRSDDDDGGNNDVSQGDSYGDYSRGNDYDDEREQEDDEADDSDDFDGDDDSADNADEQEQQDPNKVVARLETVENGEVVKSEKFKAKDYEGWFTWHPGDEINLENLSIIWGEAQSISEVEPILSQINKAVLEALEGLSHGPNLILKLNAYLNKLGGDQDSDFFGSILKLVASLPKSLIFITISVIKAFFTQEWMEVFVITTLPKIMKTVIGISMVQTLLNRLYTLAVPLINRKHRNEK